MPVYKTAGFIKMFPKFPEIRILIFLLLIYAIQEQILILAYICWNYAIIDLLIYINKRDKTNV